MTFVSGTKYGGCVGFKRLRSGAGHSGEGGGDRGGTGLRACGRRAGDLEWRGADLGFPASAHRFLVGTQATAG